MTPESEETGHNESPRRPGAGELRDESRDLLVEGVVWRVFEREVPYDRRRRRVLVFESEALSRFVRDFPPNWRALSDEDLYRLS